MKKKKSLIIILTISALIISAVIVFILITANKTLTVSFDTNGGNNIDSITVKKGKTIDEPQKPKKDGYIFLNWSIDGNEFDFSQPIKKDITLTAEWIKEIHVNLIYDNGKADESITIKQGDLLKIDEPQKKGYKFFYWQTSDNHQFDPTKPINEDITLTAIYKSIYTIIFMNDSQQFQKVEVIEGEKVKQPNSDPYKKGYEFIGWFIKDTKYNFNQPVTSDLNIEARFELIPIEPTSVAFSQTVYKIKKNDTVATNVLFTPNDANSKISLTFTSDNENVATVDKYGTITAISGGKATIKVTTEGGKSASAIVYVNDEYIYVNWNVPSTNLLNFYIDSQDNPHSNTATIHYVKFDNGLKTEKNITAENGLKLIVDNYQNCLNTIFTTTNCTISPTNYINELNSTVTLNAYFSFEQLKSELVTFKLEPTLKIKSVQNALEYSQTDIRLTESGKASLTTNCSGSFNVSENINPDYIDSQSIEFTLLNDETGYIYFTSACGQTVTITVHK